MPRHSGRESGASVAALLSNPEVAYQTEDAGGVRDQFVTFSQALPFGGGRSHLRESAEAAGAAAGLAERHELAADLL